MSRRGFAVLAIVLLTAGLVTLLVAVAAAFPADLVVVAVLIVAVLVAWRGLILTGAARVTAWVVTGILLLGVLVWVVHDGIQWLNVSAIVLLVAAVLCSRRVFTGHVTGTPAPPPRNAYVVYNVKSGGGKAISNNLADEAAARGITPRELVPGENWEVVVRDLVARGADGLMAAGGDGTQALVATVAAEHDLPFACIPTGTRNHFALDLGVDRNDVVGALDAFVDGWEKRVDLGEVGGRTFVNNVSMGVYAQAVQQQGYREAKIRTLLATAPGTLSSRGEATAAPLQFPGPDGAAGPAAAVVLVSNNTYRLGRVLGTGSRARLDAGRLGIAVIAPAAGEGRRRMLEQWETAEFTVESTSDVPLGLDGEAVVMPSPVTFRIRPGALRVRIAPQHPGASPAASLPTGFADAVRRLVHTALGRQ